MVVGMNNIDIGSLKCKLLFEAADISCVAVCRGFAVCKSVEELLVLVLEVRGEYSFAYGIT